MEINFTFIFIVFMSELIALMWVIGFSYKCYPKRDTEYTCSVPSEPCKEYRKEFLLGNFIVGITIFIICNVFISIHLLGNKIKQRPTIKFKNFSSLSYINLNNSIKNTSYENELNLWQLKYLNKQRNK
jgi:hypothetical protein